MRYRRHFSEAAVAVIYEGHPAPNGVSPTQPHPKTIWRQYSTPHCFKQKKIVLPSAIYYILWQKRENRLKTVWEISAKGTTLNF